MSNSESIQQNNYSQIQSKILTKEMFFMYSEIKEMSAGRILVEFMVGIKIVLRKILNY